MIESAVLIAGPTASGKSALALEIAGETGGVIVNADSMQVYRDLRIVTARPDDEDLARAPHELYGHVDAAVAYSTGAWLRDVEALAGSGAFRGRTAVFTGGTGLYFMALQGGLSEMPDVPDDVRTAWRERMEAEGPAELHRLLVERDPQSAERIRPSDRQRIVRALEILEASGKPIGYWQQQAGTPLVDPQTVRKIMILPDRDVLAGRIAMRFRSMMDNGAVEEIDALRRRRLDPALPAMKAIGVPPVVDWLEGRISRDVAVETAIADTRRYAKRQATWMRNSAGGGWLVRT